MQIRQGIHLSDEDADEYDKLIAESAYYDRLQYIFKIKLNSAYGALCNQYFRFFDLRMGASTTLTGQTILKHQCAETNRILTGEYDMLGDSVVYGDTDSTYFKTYCDNEHKATVIGDAVGRKVNATFPQFMRDNFFCTNEYDNLIITGREVIGSNSIFIKKKMYIINVINDDGNKVDKIKLMGVSLKKTTLPKPFQKGLSDFVKRLLKGEDWNDIVIDIKKFKESYDSSERLLELGLPKGVKGVEEYTEKYKKEHNWNTKKANLPGHVAAAIHWNECLEIFNDKESPKIISGMKIKVYYLKIKQGRFTSLAVPTDMISFPDWFINLLEDNIDIHAQLIRLIDRPLEIILDAIDYKIPTYKETIMDDLISF